MNLLDIIFQIVDLSYGEMILEKLQGFLPVYSLKVEGGGGRKRGAGIESCRERQRLRDYFGFLLLDKTLWKMMSSKVFEQE